MYLFTNNLESAKETTPVTVFGGAINTCGKTRRIRQIKIG